MELTHPRSLTVCRAFKALFTSLKIFVSHLAVVPGWVVLGEVLGQVEFSGLPPEKIELNLFDSVFDPPVAHVEGLEFFGAFWSLGCRERCYCQH